MGVYGDRMDCFHSFRNWFTNQPTTSWGNLSSQPQRVIKEIQFPMPIIPTVTKTATTIHSSSSSSNVDSKDDDDESNEMSDKTTVNQYQLNSRTKYTTQARGTTMEVKIGSSG